MRGVFESEGDIRSVDLLSALVALWREKASGALRYARPGDWTLPVPRLVLELFLRSRDRTLVEHYLGPSDLPLLRAEGFDEEFETFGLTADAGSVVRLIDGESSAAEIAEKSPADEFAALKLLAALTTLGLVHPAEAAPAPPPRRPAALAREPGSGPSTAPQPTPIVEMREGPPEGEPEPERAAQPGIEPAEEEKARSRIEQEARDADVPEAETTRERPEEQEEETVAEPLP